ncbi:FecR/PupR family sigma factor regulator, partial [Steroidobacter sp.]|uniref:FecR/PupR family sigma factor regulator n=1 Tax=Steroidobacter sp. TaxID=1978227 RepID=UPI0039F57E78
MTPMRFNRDLDLLQRLETDPVLEQAADWFIELKEDDPPVERVMEWQRWLASDQRHLEAYRGV